MAAKPPTRCCWLVKAPRQRNSLDALCKVYGIDNSNRELHGALLDARLLAEVYLAMTREQSTLLAASSGQQSAVMTAEAIRRIEGRQRGANSSRGSGRTSGLSITHRCNEKAK